LAFAHRGGAAAGDENTAAAFARAVELGFRYLETDVHATADGVPVVFHDRTLSRMTGAPDRVADLRWADLATVRVGGEAAVPRLDEVLDAWPQTRFNIDVKADRAVHPTIDVVRRTAALPRVLLASFRDARLAVVRATLGSAVVTSLGTREVSRLWWQSRRGLDRCAAAPPPPTVVAAQVPVRWYGIRVVDRRFVRHAHELGLQVHVWTVDDPALMHELLDLGVDGIMTDHVETLRDVYLARGHWPP
jgi:glycerophosphoryl diester phosphodiesterase